MAGSWMILVSLLRVLNWMKSEKDLALYLTFRVSDGNVPGFYRIRRFWCMRFPGVMSEYVCCIYTKMLSHKLLQSN